MFLKCINITGLRLESVIGSSLFSYSYPFLSFLIAYVAGIVVSQWLPAYITTTIMLGITAVLIVSALLIKTDWTLLPPFLTMGMVMGLMQVERRQVTCPDRYADYYVVVVEQPTKKAYGVRADAEIVAGELTGRKVRVFMERRDVEVGDVFRINCKLKKPKNRGSDFDYERYMLVKNIPFVAYINKERARKVRCSIDGLPIWDRAKIGAQRIRQSIVRRLGDRGLDEQQLAVASAMALGDKSMLSEETHNIYSTTGASHILALSGTHMAIIYMMLTMCGAKILRISIAWQMAVLTTVWAYVFLVGMSASVVRAAAMITIYSIASLTHRNGNGLNSVILSAFIFTLINPLVIYDVGFQLSYFAVVAIILIAKPIDNMLPEKFAINHPIWNYFLQLAIVSVAANIGAAPLIAHYFSRLPVYFLLTNLVVLPLTVVILWIAVSAIITSIIPFIGTFMVAALGGVVWVLNKFLFMVASLPMACVENIRLSAVQVVLLYIMIAAGCKILYIISYKQLRMRI